MVDNNQNSKLSRRQFLSITSKAALLSFACSCSPTRQRISAKKPNIAVLFIDDLAYGDVEPFGCPDIPTPNINRIAENGTCCDNGYVTAPICSPSRASLMTGIYPQRFGMDGLTDRGKPLPKGHLTLAESMRRCGYATGMVGRWDMGDKTQGPLDCGFEEMAKRPRPPKDTKGPTYFGRDGSYWTEIQSPEMAEFVERHKNEPFFLYFAPLAVHSPVTEVPEKYLDRVPEKVTGKRRYLAGSIIAMDDAVGTLLDKLDETGLADDTLIFFIGDNGGSPHSKARNLPWRGAKASPFEGGIHVPYIVSWPKVIPKGKRFDGLVSSLDVYPTCTAAANSTLPFRLDGVNLVPHLTGNKKGDPHEFLYWRFLETLAWGRYFDFKYLDYVKNVDKSPYIKQSRAIRHGKWKWLRWQDTKDHAIEHQQLIDLENDPGAKENLIDEKPEIAEFLKKKYEEWEATLPEPDPDAVPGPQGPCPGGRGWVIKDQD